MKYLFRQSGSFVGNPVANVLMLILAAVAVTAALIVGFFAFIVLAGIVIILSAIFGIRVWWMSRKLQKQAGSQSPRREDTAGVIEGEYHVVSSRVDRHRDDTD